MNCENLKRIYELLFYGEKLLATENSAIRQDISLISKLEINPLKPNPAMESPRAQSDKELSPSCN